MAVRGFAPPITLLELRSFGYFEELNQGDVEFGTITL